MSMHHQTAWHSAHQAARRVLLNGKGKEGGFQPLGPIWHVISGQLRATPDQVDLDTIRVAWPRHSLQWQLIHQILQEAGFRQEGSVYRWIREASEQAA